MKSKLKFFGILLVAISMLSLQSCSTVEAGHVGIKFYLLGKDKGVDHEVLDPGRYYIGVNERLYEFPTFTQNYVWTHNPAEGSPNDESITFQTVEGLSVNTDVGITYHLEESKVPLVFEKYKRGIDEITDIFLRNMVRDAFVSVASQSPVETVYGKGKNKLINSVEVMVKSQTDSFGIVVDKIYLIGDMRLPKTVIAALNSKIEATQRAQQRENELREAQAKAKKKVADAEGEAESILVKAESQAKANKILSASITPTLVEYERIKKWDGKLPKYSGSGSMLFNVK